MAAPDPTTTRPVHGADQDGDAVATVRVGTWFCPRCGVRDREAGECPADRVPLRQVGTGDDLSGTVIQNKYVLVERLGCGAFGAVYRAWHRVLHAEVAVKMLLEGIADDPAVRRQFLKEARILVQLSSPRIVALRDADQDDQGRLFLVMELLEGQDLRDFLKTDRSGADGEKPDLALVLEVARQVAEGLADAHARGVVHRDLKPSNIRVRIDDQGQPHIKLMDFGIARLARTANIEGSLLGTSGGVKGTPAYISPEQCRGGEVDHRADLYALGVMLYEWVTGRRPFRTPTVEAALIAHVTEIPEPPSRVSTRHRVPPDLERLILQLMEKDPDRRPRTATEVVRRLETLQQGIAAPRPERQSPGPGRRWIPWIGAVAAALTLLAAGIWALGVRDRQMPEPSAPGGPAVVPSPGSASAPEAPGGGSRGAPPAEDPVPASAASARAPESPASAPGAGTGTAEPAASSSASAEPPATAPASSAAPGHGSGAGVAAPVARPANPDRARQSPRAAEPRAPARTPDAPPAAGSLTAPGSAPSAMPGQGTPPVRPAARIEVPDEADYRDPSRAGPAPAPSRPLPTEERAGKAFDEMDQILQRRR
ncbi:protein kinase [Myxococcota bacterium]|nr:protein kinase [Myxococcota bacterium]